MPFRRINPEVRPLPPGDPVISRIDPPARQRRVPAAPASNVVPAPEAASATTPASPNRNPDGSYIVGKGRPPIEHQFEKGTSGNPKGRPKGAKGVNTLTIEVLGALLPVRTPAGETLMNAPQFALSKMRELAAKGELPAILAVLRHWAQAVPEVQPRSEPSAPIVLSPSDQQLIEMLIAGFGVKDERIVDAEPENVR